MKRIFSNKSGFTLIEIIVAFAIFAIMASMILQMLRLTVAQRNNNAEYATSITTDSFNLATHYMNDADKYGASETADGQFNLDFQSVGAGNIAIDYAVRAALPTDTTDPNYIDPTDSAYTSAVKNEDGINYFVGNVDYTTTSDPNPPDDITNPLGNNVTSRVDTRISGSKNLKFVWINQVVKDTSSTVPAGHSRYFIECYASSDGMPDEDIPYAQYRLRFCSSTETSIVETEEDGKTYEYTIPVEAVIADYGYINDDKLVWDTDCIDAGDHVISSATQPWNRYKVDKTSASTLRVGCAFIKPSWDQSGYPLEGSIATRIWVEFVGDPGLTIESFGQNVTDVDNRTTYGRGYKFTNYPADATTGEMHPNIYGAFEYNKVEK